jgi:hypothetical protein
VVTTAVGTGLRIARIKNQATGARNANEEWILIVNEGTKSWELAGGLITDETDRQRAPHIYQLPRLLSDGQTWRFDPGEALYLMTGPGNDVFIARPRSGRPQFQFHWNRDAFVWNNSGDRVYLRHPDGRFLTQPFPIP